MPVEDVFSVTGRGRVVTFQPVPGGTIATCADENGNGNKGVAHLLIIAEDVEGEALAASVIPDREVDASGMFTVTVVVTDADGTVLVDRRDVVLFAHYSGQD